MKQVTLFTDIEVKKYSFSQKINYILDELIKSLQPVFIRKEIAKYFDRSIQKDKTFSYIISVITKDIKQINNIISFGDIFIKIIDNELICIYGFDKYSEDFSYTFHSNMLLEMKKRFKRVKQIK